jgi:hypothetical protein
MATDRATAAHFTTVAAICPLWPARLAHQVGQELGDHHAQQDDDPAEQDAAEQRQDLRQDHHGGFELQSVGRLHRAEQTMNTRAI